MSWSVYLSFSLLSTLAVCLFAIQHTARSTHVFQVAELRQPTETSFVKTRTMLRTVGEHQRAKAKFQSFLDEASTAEEFEARSALHTEEATGDCCHGNLFALQQLQRLPHCQPA